MNHSDYQIPQLNLSGFDAGGGERAAFLADLRAAAHDFGFFYLVGHGIEPELLRDLLELTRRFFALPEADKLAIEMVTRASPRKLRVSGAIGASR